jgi:hypothetical protein
MFYLRKKAGMQAAMVWVIRAFTSMPTNKITTKVGGASG